jgi:hypothetical protein
MRSTLLLLLTSASIVAAGEVQLSGREAEAVQEATRIFKIKQGSKIDGNPVYGDLAHYTVNLTRKGEQFEVDFLPGQPPLKSNEAGTGGGTTYGCEVVYVFSLNPLKLVEEHYTR